MRIRHRTWRQSFHPHRTPAAQAGATCRIRRRCIYPLRGLRSGAVGHGDHTSTIRLALSADMAQERLSTIRRTIVSKQPSRQGQQPAFQCVCWRRWVGSRVRCFSFGIQAATTASTRRGCAASGREDIAAGGYLPRRQACTNPGTSVLQALQRPSAAAERPAFISLWHCNRLTWRRRWGSTCWPGYLAYQLLFWCSCT